MLTSMSVLESWYKSAQREGGEGEGVFGAGGEVAGGFGDGEEADAHDACGD